MCIRDSPNGGKFFLRNSRKHGCVFVIGHLESSAPLCFCEGYATAVTLFQATKYPIVVCFDAGNLIDVALEFHARYPQKNKIICADNDLVDRKTGRIKTPEENTGVIKATRAAHLTQSVLVIPEFVDLSTGPSDFNDLAAQTNLAEVRRQIHTAIDLSLIHI